MSAAKGSIHPPCSTIVRRCHHCQLPPLALNMRYAMGKKRCGFCNGKIPAAIVSAIPDGTFSV